ncbi:MAG: hypothetical protein ACLR23_16915 [Clostridia bacterium]
MILHLADNADAKDENARRIYRTGQIRGPLDSVQSLAGTEFL